MPLRPPGPDWPFAPARVRPYYGWVVLIVSTLGILASIPGQTMGVAVFTEPLMVALGLDRTTLSLAYLAGTVGSSLFLTSAGRLYDRVGGRVLVVAASLGLGVVLVFLAVLDRILAQLGAVGGAGAFLLVLLAYLGVRFFGQGVLTSASRNLLLPWFERRRGLVGGIRGVFVSLGFSLAPPVLAALIALFDWRGALLALALVCGPVFALLALLLARDAPEPCGLLPDGEPPGEDAPPAPPPGGFSLDAARRHPGFWLYSLSLAMHALFGTAVTFHVVSIFAEAGRTAGEAFGYFLPVALVSTTTNLVVSAWSDRAPLRPFLIAMHLCFLLMVAGLALLASEGGYWLLVAGQGIGGGIWGMVSNLAFVRLFGRAALGAVSGLNASLMVFFSAIGPAFFALGLDLSGSFRAPTVLCGVGFLVLLAFALLLPRTLDGERAPSSG